VYNCASSYPGGTSGAQTVKSFAEKEATPITTGYSSYLMPSLDDSLSNSRYDELCTFYPVLIILG